MTITKRPTKPARDPLAPLRALIYARVSTTSQKEKGYSLPTQRERCEEFIAEMGWLPVGYEQDDASGMILDREGLDRVREMVRNNEVDIVVVYELDRLSRKLAHQIIIREEMHKLGVQLWYAKSQSKSGQTTEELLSEHILGLLGEVEYEKIRERTQRGRRKKAREGKVIGAGVAPFGYRYEGQQGQKVIVIDEDQAATVRLVFELFLSGMGVFPIAEELTKRGLPTPGDLDGRKYRKATKRHRAYANWGVSTVYRILRQRAYRGEFVHYAHTMQDGHLRVNQEQDTRVVVTVPAIVEPAIFDAAQGKIDAGIGLSLRNARANDLMLARRLRCDCGRSYQTARTRARKVRSGEAEDFYFAYYRCWGRLPAGGRVCSRPHLKVRVLDPWVWQWMSSTVLNPQWYDEHLRLLQTGDGKADLRKRIENDRARLIDKQERLGRRLKNYQRMRADEEMDDKEYREAAAEVRSELAAIEAELAELVVPAEPLQWDEDEIANIRDFAAVVQAGAQGDDPVDRRRLADTLDLRAYLEERDGVLGLRLRCMLADEWEPMPEDTDDRGKLHDESRRYRTNHPEQCPRCKAYLPHRLAAVNHYEMHVRLRELDARGERKGRGSTREWSLPGKEQWFRRGPDAAPRPPSLRIVKGKTPE